METRSFFTRLTRDTQEKSGQARMKTAALPAQHAAKKAPHNGEQCALDVYQTNDAIVIKALLAGVRPGDLDISIANDVLTIRGIRAEDDAVRPEDYYYRECFAGPFSRSVILPENSGEDAIKATLKNGVLTIRIPKEKKKNIAINTH